MQFLLHLLEIPQSQGNEQRDTAPQVTRSELERLTCADLRQKCKDQGVAGYGSKATLIDRILNQDDETTSPRTKSLEAVLIEAWFLKPKSSPEMKTGPKNEDSISSHLPPFFTANSSFTIQQMKSYGLLCRPEQRYLVCSPDGIAYVTPPQSVTFFAVLEYKTRTTPTTIAKENAVATKHGKFVTVTLNSVNDSKTFKKLVPDQAHRSQLLHNLVCSSVKNGFLVYASTSTVIRVIHLVLSDDVVEAYLLAFERVNGSCLNWIYSSNEALPHLSTEELGHWGDIATLKQHLGLWRQLNDLVDKNDGPLPPAKHIIPTVIATWNRVKGDIDVYSRFLKNVHARHLHLPPLAAIWIRMLLSIVYNAYQSSQLLQQFKSENMSFNSFFSGAAQCIANLVAVENADLDFNNINATGEDDDEGTASIAMSPKASTAYNKLNRFNEDPEFRQLRLSKRSTHHADLLSSNKQLTCIVCYQLNHDEENMPHSRKGFKTRYFCTICNVPLCKASRWKDGQSCFDRFHLLSHVPKPCQPSSSHRPKKIRPPPPSRKRSRDSIEPNERAITRLVPKTRRRSSRLMVRGA